MRLNILLKAIIGLYTGLLWLYPRRLRTEFGDEMQAVFRSWLTDAAAEGSQSVLRMLTRELGSLPGAVLQAHLSSRAERTA